MFSSIHIIWSINFISLSKRIYWPNKSPSSRISTYFSITSCLVHSWCYNSFLFIKSCSSGIFLWLSNSCIRSCHLFSLFSNNSSSWIDRLIKNFSIRIWICISIWIKLSPVWSIMSSDPLSVMDIVFNLFLLVFINNSCSLIMSVFLLFGHSCSMGRSSIFFTAMFSCYNFCG